ncbi:acetate/propionate family kinase [Paenarthrobacter aromaticivorans]|uniref:Acetate kinase n=1 Tax=Paenarthrobacter aromaticivorans TaxID=2849150 RepID=A0ABS6I4P8_9MICC|nr:acetate/propionate family kinase [Paenarthrobacter sp. MMS21-TAE1-1]MBU8865808.1 acetate/propionate family kinase [Paenarthrobacter sp. MMS21-TAE1-1]
MHVLVLNPGSSSLKYHVRDTSVPEAEASVQASGQVNWAPQARSDPSRLDEVFNVINAGLAKSTEAGHIEAIGHRVVHGGDQFRRPTRVTADVVAAVERLGALAPLHNPASAACMRTAGIRWPDVPQVAVFDTAFHASIPEYAARYAIPEDVYKAQRVKRYGFHGISVEMACRDAAGFLGVPGSSLNAVVAHVGNGASVTAVRGGMSVDTSMGMTPLEGLVMGTRSGDIDPSIVLLMQREGATPDEVDEILNHRSGMLALAGTADMRDVGAAVERGEPKASLALDIYAYRLAKYIAAYSMVVRRPDALVFTGGVGENSVAFRTKVLSWLLPLGLAMDQDRNLSPREGIRVVSADGSSFPVLVVPSDEERAIAEATASLLEEDTKDRRGRRR